jgi:hypothetical protein
MRTVAHSLLVASFVLTLASLAGCMTVQAKVPEDAVRQMARKDGADLAAICSHDGRSFSEGAILCMAGQRMSCDDAGRWIEQGACGEAPAVAADFD